jgi:hypothetical protein
MKFLYQQLLYQCFTAIITPLPTSDHLGVLKTITKICKSLVRKTRNADNEECVHHCTICGSSKPTQNIFFLDCKGESTPRKLATATQLQFPRIVISLS